MFRFFWPFLLILACSGCSTILQAGKSSRANYYYYSLKYASEDTPLQKLPIRLGVYPITSDLEFRSKVVLYRDEKEPDKIGRYSGVYYNHRWYALPQFLLDDLLETYLPLRLEQYVSSPSMSEVDYSLRLHLKHFEEFQGEKESKALVEFQYVLQNADGEIWYAGQVRQEKTYPTDPGELNNMVNSLSLCAQGCMQQILNKIADELELEPS